MGSIRDALNSFGTATAAGELPNKIYVGRTLTDGTMAYGHPRPPEGGEVSIPYYVEFCATDSIAPPTGVCTLNVYGSEENDSVTAPTGNWRLVGSLEVPAGKWTVNTKPRVAVSENAFKWFKCSVAGTGSAHIRADLMRYSD
jgi:hypothetical protein